MINSYLGLWCDDKRYSYVKLVMVQSTLCYTQCEKRNSKQPVFSVALVDA